MFVLPPALSPPLITYDLLPCFHWASKKQALRHDVHLEALASLAGLPKLVARSLPGFVNNKRLQVTLVVLHNPQAA